MQLPTGYARVEFERAKDADAARRLMDGGQIDGQEVRVVFVAPDSAPASPRSPRHPLPQQQQQQQQHQARRVLCAWCCLGFPKLTADTIILSLLRSTTAQVPQSQSQPQPQPLAKDDWKTWPWPQSQSHPQQEQECIAQPQLQSWTSQRIGFFFFLFCLFVAVIGVVTFPLPVSLRSHAACTLPRPAVQERRRESPTHQESNSGFLP